MLAAKIRRVGNSCVITIPQREMKRLGLSVGDTIKFEPVAVQLQPVARVHDGETSRPIGMRDDEVIRALGGYRLTEEERRRGLRTVEELRRLRNELLEARGGVPFEPSYKLINESRDERSRQLAP